MEEISLFSSCKLPSSLAQPDQAKEKKGERGVLEIQRCHEAILLSPLNLSPSLIPLLPAHSFFPVFSPGPEPERDGPAEEYPRRCPTSSRSNRLATPTQTPGLAGWYSVVSRVRHSQERTGCLARTHSWMQGGGNAYTEIHTHFLEGFHTPKPNTDL